MPNAICPSHDYDHDEEIGCPYCRDEKAVAAAAAKCPERIYLQIADEIGEAVPEGGERTWYQDRINKSDVEYVRADRRPSPWIACAERMPEGNGHVWTYSRKAQENLRYRTGLGFQRFSEQDNCWIVTTEPTHWQPLPPPPAPSSSEEGER